MIGRKAIVGLSLLCALMFCAFAAQGAQAAKGTTAVTCVKVGGTLGGFTDAHCAKEGSGEFALQDTITAGTKTAITGSNAKTEANTTAAKRSTLKGTSLGVEVLITCTTVSSTGEIENKAGPPMSIEGKKIFVTYGGCIVEKPGPNICKVHSPGKTAGNITTNEITAESGTMNETTGEMSGKFKPTTGTTFVKLEFESEAGQFCALPTTNVEGFVESTNPNGEATPKASPTAEGAATVTFETEAMSHLTVFGGASTYTGAETVSMSAGNPIAVVTTAT
jgi:hypothetical protein